MGRNKKGVAIAFTLVAMTAVLALIALVIDTSYAFSSKTKIKNAVDLAALSGISQLTDATAGSILNAKNNALTFLNNNLSATLAGYTPVSLTDSNLSIQTGFYDF